MSFGDCMKNKMISHYSTEYAECIGAGINNEKEMENALKCIVALKGLADPEVWVAKQLAYYVEWSAECAFQAT